MAKKRQMLAPSDGPVINIDEILNSGGTDFIIDSPVTPERKIKLMLQTISSGDILERTTVIKENLRNQEFLNEVSLAPLIRKLAITKGNVVPAIGRIDGDIIEVVFGSRRRLACHLGGYDLKILTSTDITNEEARILAEVENESTDISLIERGMSWLVHYENNMSYRAIESEVEHGEFSHTMIKSGCDGARIPKEILMLYPSIEVIGRPTITKLTYALGFKPDIDALVKHVRAEHHDLIKKLEDTYSLQGEVKAGPLTTAICEFAQPKIKTSQAWPKTVALKKNKQGQIEGVSLKQPLTKEQEVRLMNFLSKMFE